MADRNVKGILIAAFIWILIIAVLAVAAKFYVIPYFQRELINKTGSSSQYKHEIRLSADTFSGYAILRSPAFKNELLRQGIKLTIVDDQADYRERMTALEKGTSQLAVFTIDSFITTGAEMSKFPGSIILVIDETNGADAMISYSDAVKSIQDLDSPDAQIVLTPRSPSDFLARTIIAHFSLPNLPTTWWIEANGAEDVYRQFLSANRSQKRAYSLWEPFVSKALKEPGSHLLIDSSKLKGYIIDVLVAERYFLRDSPELVQTVVESYLRAAYSFSQKENGMATLIMDDAASTGTQKLDPETATKLVKGIEWKNTMENYAYFGLLPEPETAGTKHLEDIIGSITDVLIKTGSLSSNPVEGQEHTLFYDKVLSDLKAAAFHPGKKMAVVEGIGPASDQDEKIRGRTQLQALSDTQWASLKPVGKMRVKPISFARGTSRINIQSSRDLTDLAKNLDSWPDYYLLILGNARPEGDPEENLKLARERADAVAGYLKNAGVHPDRMKVEAVISTTDGADAQSVLFELKQLPY